MSEWESVRSDFKLENNHENETRVQSMNRMMTNDTPSDVTSESRNFIIDVITDIRHVLFNVRSYIELPNALYQVFLKDNRGIIVGVVLVIITLSLIAFR